MVAIKFLVDNEDPTAASSLRRVTLVPPYTIAALLQKTIPGAVASNYVIQVAQFSTQPNPVMHGWARLDTNASLVDAIRGFQRAGRVLTLRFTRVSCEAATTAAITPSPTLPISPPASPPPYRWLSPLAGGTDSVDVHVGFRLSFTTAAKNTVITIRHVCVSWYNLFVDGALI